VDRTDVIGRSSGQFEFVDHPLFIEQLFLVHLRRQDFSLGDFERGRPLIRAGDRQFDGQRFERKYLVIPCRRARRIAERAVHDDRVDFRPLKLDDLLYLFFLAERVPPHAPKETSRWLERGAFVLADRLAFFDEHEIAGMEKVLGQGYAADFESFEVHMAGIAFSVI
jgi:hypothetical protein